MKTHIKKLSAFIAAWILYGLGHLVSLVMHIEHMGWLCPVYNRLMLSSSGVQDWAGNEVPWKIVEEKKNPSICPHGKLYARCEEPECVQAMYDSEDAACCPHGFLAGCPVCSGEI